MSETRISDGARIMGAGVPITIGGEDHRLLFGALALEMIEDEFDGLLNFTIALNGGYRTKRFKSVRIGLLAGLAHEGVTAKEVAALMDQLTGAGFKDLDVVHRAICEAFDQAIPPPAKDKRGSKASAQESASHGPASTAEPSEKAESLPASSAA